MYRDAEEALGERRQAVLDRAKRQLAALSAEDLETLPEALKRELAALEPRLTPEGVSAAAIADAELALDERERLLEQAQVFLRRQRKAARRARRDQALIKGLWQKRMRSVWLAGLIGLLLLGPCYYLARARAVSGCRQSAACKYRGDCVPSAGLSCTPGSDNDCLRSEDCRTYGFCSAVGERCQARLARDCERLERCQAPRSCTVLYGLCVGVTR